MNALGKALPVDRWTLLVLGFCAVYQAMASYLDYSIDVTLFALYLVPVMALAWMSRGLWWLVWAVLGSALWYLVRKLAFPANEPIETEFQGLLQFLTRLVILGVVGLLCARLRALSRSPVVFSSSHDASGLLSSAGLRDELSRRFNRDRFSAGSLAMVLLDVDRRVTAYGGHTAEHTALVGAMIAKNLLRHSGPDDLCVRLSPNHFLLIKAGADETAANTVHAALRDAVPEITRSLDDTVSISSLLLFSPEPVANLTAMRIHAENRLTTLKVVGEGKHHAERWNPARTSAA